jgi:hypothetical protein
MAIFIFEQNSHLLYRIAENQDVLNNNKNFIESEYDLVTVSQEYFNSIRLNKKTIVSRVGDTITLEDISVSFTEIFRMQENINSIMSVLDNYLAINSHKPMASDIITYKNYIQTINPSTLITEVDMSVEPHTPAIPLNSSIEEYSENQGIKAINLLQLL